MNAKEFKDWVVSQEEGSFIGNVAKRCSCPIAQFYGIKYPTKYPALTIYRTRKSWFDNGVKNAPNDLWEQALVVAIDSQNKQYLTREDVMRLMNGLREFQDVPAEQS